MASMSTPTERATVQVRREQRDALTRVAGELTASEGKRYSLADAIQRLLDFWRAGQTGRTA